MQAGAELTLVQASHLAGIDGRIHGLPIGVLGLVVAVEEEGMGRGVRGGRARGGEEGGQRGDSLYRLLSKAVEEARKVANKGKSTLSPPPFTRCKQPDSTPLCVLLDVKSCFHASITLSPGFSMAVVVAVPARIDVLTPAAHPSGACPRVALVFCVLLCKGCV